MRKIWGVLAALVLVSVGCAHGQVPSNPTVYTCPNPALTGTWTALQTAATEITGTASTDTPGSGVWCYTVQSANNTFTPPLTSVPSNVVMVTTTTALPVVDLSWQAPVNSPVSVTGYIVSRIAASPATIAPPTQSSPTTVAINVRPASASGPEMALNAPLKVMGHAVQAK